MDLSKFKPIVLVSNRHLINENGDIFSIRVNRLMAHQIKNGYHAVSLNKTTYYIHRLVMITFAPIPDYQCMYINHKDKNRSNNNISNLEWCTQKENLEWNKTNSTLSFLTHEKVKQNTSDLPNEYWVETKESPNYLVSNIGRVKSISRPIRLRNGLVKIVAEKILIPQKYSNKYLFSILAFGGKTKGCLIHRLIAEAFIPNPENKPCVNHKNGIRTDNRIDNLEWCTKRENMIHAINVLGTGRFGETSPTSKYKESEVVKLKELFKTGKYSKIECGRIAGIGEGSSQAILNGKNWKHLNKI